MGGRAGGGARSGGGGYSLVTASKKQAKIYAEMSSNRLYAAKQNLANWITNKAGDDPTRYSSDLELGDFLKIVQKGGGFSGDVATTVLKSMGGISYMKTKTANVSSKQAWILANAGIKLGVKSSPAADLKI